MELRRRAPRVATTGWSGRYIVEDDPASEWSECRVIDISVLGVGLELFGSVLERNLMSRPLVIQVQAPVGKSVSIRLVGRIKNLSQGSEGGVRAGLEFVGLSEMERRILEVMELMRVAW